MKKAMISQPMGGLAKDELLAVRDKAKAELEALDYEVLNAIFASFDNDAGLMDLDHIALLHLGKSLEEMAKCDLVYFCEGWQDKRGCRIEHSAATAYGIKVMYQGK